MLAELRTFLLTVAQAELRQSDAVQYSIALLAMNNSDWNTTMSTISNHCWPVYVSSQHLVGQHSNFKSSVAMAMLATPNSWKSGDTNAATRTHNVAT